MTALPIEDFALERYFARWEFAVRHQLSASDVEPLSLSEVLALADEESRLLWDRLSLGYTESAGHPLLRAEIARLYEQIDPEQVVVLAGAEEGIFLAMHALLSAGDDAIVVTPAFQSLYSIPASLGARVHSLALRSEQRWELDLDEIQRAVTPRTRAISVTFPHNPTGSHITPDTQRRLIDIADSAGAILFSDEVYRGLEYGGAPSLPAAADLSATAVSLGVMSKSFALPGLRIGWVASRNRALMDRIRKLKDYTTICSSAPSEILALIGLRARERVLQRSRSIVERNLAHATGFLASQVDDVEWIAPRAGSVAFPRLLRRNADARSTLLAEQHRVLMIPGSVFGDFDAHFRLGLGRRDLPDALEALGRVLRD
jgi:aspartate/methionine/tyrosine aminotransferase